MMSASEQQHTLDELVPDAFDSPADESLGYRAPLAQQAAGVTYRQLDYWARTGLVEPSIRSATGSGSQRLYSFKDILNLRLVKNLLGAGVSLRNIRVAIDHLRERGVADLAAITLVSDGTSVYECTTDDEVIDLLRGGQGVFAIALGRTLTDTVKDVTPLVAEPGEAAPAESGHGDHRATA